MSKPTDAELATAIRAAIEMKEHDDDPHFIARSLLNLQFRMRFYEELLKLADLYLNHGQSESDHMQLLRHINKLKEIELRSAKMDIEDFGLD